MIMSDIISVCGVTSAVFIITTVIVRVIIWISDKIGKGIKPKHKKMTYTQEKHIECSSCLNCGWRIPFWNNDTVSCLFGIMDKPDMEECYYRPKCSMYITDIELEKHLKSILKIKETETDD